MKRPSAQTGPILELANLIRMLLRVESPMVIAGITDTVLDSLGETADSLSYEQLDALVIRWGVEFR